MTTNCTCSCEPVSTTCILYTVGIMAVSLLMFFAFQTSVVLKERDFLKESLTKLESPLEQSQKLNAQFGGLVVGTQKLAAEGNAVAKDFVQRLKKIGVIMEPQAQPDVAPVATPEGMIPAGLPRNLKPMAPVPAAKMEPAKAPVKP